ncbi:hypothetical protein [Streptosporangium sp. NPDC006007]|uniref:hypothetical protein n=1 Tax=Streptosporangium sp. NPDC006007 TaxID=3154575 RepID=UPI0033A06EBB
MRDPETHHLEAALTVHLALRDALGLDPDDATLDAATDRVMARLLERGYTVTRPARLSSRVEKMPPAARAAYDLTGGEIDDRLHAVVTELIPAIAYRLGRPRRGPRRSPRRPPRPPLRWGAPVLHEDGGAPPSAAIDGVHRTQEKRPGEEHGRWEKDHPADEPDDPVDLVEPIGRHDPQLDQNRLHH